MIEKSIINVGIVGLGRSGWDIHAASLRDNPCYKIVAVCDINIQRIKQAETELGCKGYSSYSSFLQHPCMELIIVASPTKEHFWMAKGALEKGIHVILEKPLASFAIEIQKLKKITEESGKILIPYYNFRFSNDFIIIKDILKEGLIGSLFLIKRQIGYFNRRDDWQSLLHESGGIINAATIHHVDQIIQIAGQLPIESWCDIRRIVSKGDAPDHSKIMLRFPNNCIGDIEVSWAEALSGCEWLIYGTRGSIRKFGSTLTVRWFVEDEITHGGSRERSYYSEEKISWKEREYCIEEGFSPAYYDMVQQAIQKRGSVPVTLESAIDTMIILENCLKTSCCSTMM